MWEKKFKNQEDSMAEGFGRKGNLRLPRGKCGWGGEVRVNFK